jgi:hypothetical protein
MSLSLGQKIAVALHVSTKLATLGEALTEDTLLILVSDHPLKVQRGLTIK